MRFFIIFAFLMTSNTQAQSEQKRPSWSQGLPERETTLSAGQPVITLKAEQNSQEVASPTIENATTERPEIELEAFKAPQLNYKIQLDEPIKANEIEVSVEEREVIARRAGPDSRVRKNTQDFNSKTVNSLHDDYSWKVLSTTPIEMPGQLSNTESINVDIHINPDGSVEKVTTNDPNVSSRMLKYASKSIENWKFEAPEKLGITDVMSKNFAIEIKS